MPCRNCGSKLTFTCGLMSYDIGINSFMRLRKPLLSHPSMIHLDSTISFFLLYYLYSLYLHGLPMIHCPFPIASTLQGKVKFGGTKTRTIKQSESNAKNANLSLQWSQKVDRVAHNLIVLISYLFK